MARKPSIDPDAVHLLPGSDVFAISLGWLLSLRGFVFLVFCTLGVTDGIPMISHGLNNAPIEIENGALHGAVTGCNVRIRGTIDAQHLMVGKRRLGTREYALAPLQGAQGAVIIFFPERLPDALTAKPVERWFEGELTVLSHGSGEIDTDKIGVKSLFYNSGVAVTDGAFVIADSIIPEFRWWYLLLTGSCLAGLAYIAYRVAWALVFVRDRGALLRYLVRRKARRKKAGS